MNPAKCHPNKQVVANGLCRTCYTRRWRARNRPRSNALQRLYNRRRWARMSQADREAETIEFTINVLIGRQAYPRAIVEEIAYLRDVDYLGSAKVLSSDIFGTL